MASEDKQNGLAQKVKEVIDQILPPTEVELEEIKEEIWQDLSNLYYKYEDLDQKKAFREVMQEIAEKIINDKWENVYKKLYREGQKEKTF